MTTTCITNATLATMDDEGSYGLINNAAVLIEAGKISWAGAQSNADTARLDAAERIFDCRGRLVTPGLIDCHTHLVYGGDRAGEFEMRLEGAGYEEIARAGGGIVSTVNQTRRASRTQLFDAASARLQGLMDEGVTTIEIKSGYGLDTETEIKMLAVADQLALHHRLRVQKTFLGAHALPPEYNGDKPAYIKHVCEQMLPAAHDTGLVDAVDGFCEGIAFSVAQMSAVFDRALALDLPVKLHAEQLSHLGGAVMAAGKGALSVDHIEYLKHDEAAVLAQSGTAAVVLPGAFYTLKETQLPPFDALKAQGVPIAIATDLNPGSSPLNSLLLAMNMACTLFSLTPQTGAGRVLPLMPQKRWGWTAR